MTAEPANVASNPPASRKKRHHVWLWIFLIVQAIFIIWIITGAASASGTPSDCGTLDAATCNDASDVGTAIGVGLIIGLWIAVDVVLLLIKIVVQLTRRGSKA